MVNGNGDHRRIGEVTIAVLERELRRLDDDVDVVGVVEPRDVEAVEQGEDRERSEALGRRRKARGLAAAIAHP